MRKLLDSPWQTLSIPSAFVGQHLNQSRNRGWGKEGEGEELWIGEAGGVGDIEGTSRVHVNSGKGWEKTVHMPSCVTYVTQEHLVFVEWVLTYLATGVV